MKQINSVAIVGMGALGILFGKEIADTLGEQAVRYVMDEERFAKYKGSEVIINGKPWAVPVVNAADAEPADLVIVAVKGTGLEAALDVMKTSVGLDTIIISVLNGISSVFRCCKVGFGSFAERNCLFRGFAIFYIEIVVIFADFLPLLSCKILFCIDLGSELTDFKSFVCFIPDVLCI